jgi:hypothetical protein
MGGNSAMKLRYALIAVYALGLLASGCDVLKKNIATSGPQRYKSEVAAIAAQMKEELTDNGKLNPGTRKKFDGIMSKWEGEMGNGSTYRYLKEAQDKLNQMESDPANAFNHKQSAEYKIQEALRALETEVQSEQ